MKYVVAYDVSEDRLRLRVAEAIDDFGIRVQESVFECELDAKELQRLEATLQRLIGESQDASVRLYPLTARGVAGVVRIGAQRIAGGEEPWIVV